MTKKWPFKNFFYFVIIKCRTCHGIQTRSTIISNPSRKMKIIFIRWQTLDKNFSFKQIPSLPTRRTKDETLLHEEVGPLRGSVKRHLLGEEEESMDRPSALNPKIQVARNCVSTQLPSWMRRKATKRRDVTWRKWATKEKKKKKVIRGEKCPRRKIGVKNVAKGKINAWSRKRNIAIEEEIDLFRVCSDWRTLLTLAREEKGEKRKTSRSLAKSALETSIL